MAFTQRLIDEGVDPSVGSVGDALDNALAETTVGSFKNEVIRRQGPWRDVNQVELATAEWVLWFNTQRPHEYLDDFTPEAVGVDPSVGSVGDALDNALAETTVGSFKNEVIRRQGPWRDVNQVELATAEWVLWFNTQRPHEYLDDFTPEAVEKLHYDHRHTPPKTG